jgi:hypothetical protein
MPFSYFFPALNNRVTEKNKNKNKNAFFFVWAIRPRIIQVEWLGAHVILKKIFHFYLLQLLK